MDEIATVAATQQIWEEIVEAAKTARAESGNPWLHGYRSGMVRAYAVVTGLDVDEVTGFLISELRRPS